MHVLRSAQQCWKVYPGMMHASHLSGYAYIPTVHVPGGVRGSYVRVCIRGTMYIYH